MAAADRDISEEELAQYDRQIRLWGLDAQKRLRQAKVLAVGLGGLGAEVVKNLVLAGIKAITLLDHRNVTENDMHSQLFITPDHIGTNRAEASKAATQELNPNVIVTTDTTPIYNKKDHFFRDFDIVCLTEVPIDVRLKINQVCRMEGVKFFCGDVFGFYGYTFADLGMHEFVKEEQKKAEVVIDDGSGEPVAKKAKVNKESPKANEETVLVKITDEFCSLEESFLEDWRKRSKRSMRQSSHVFFIMQIIEIFTKLEKRSPSRSESDRELLLKLRLEIRESFNLPESFILEEFADFCVSQLNAVCAITGGVMGQEIIKAVSQRDAPHNNYFFFDGRSHAGIVDQLSPP